MEKLLSVRLGYGETNGSVELREAISKLYPNTSSENVLVTNGSAEANFIAMWSTLEPGDELILMLPNYMQIWGIAKNQKYKLKTFHLIEEQGWAINLNELRSAITPKTKLIAVCNPDNPTGHILTQSEMTGIIECADQVGAWILADEVYRGADRLSEDENPSFYGLYDKIIAVGSMSKAYGLPGLRLGWAVAPEDMIDEIWARHEYLTISATMLSNKLATIALSPEVRPKLINRARQYIRQGFPIISEWINNHKDMFNLNPPAAGAICFIRYHFDMNSTAFCERLRKEKSVLIVPGDHFDMDHFVRISFGLPEDYLKPALDRIHDFIINL